MGSVVCSHLPVALVVREGCTPHPIVVMVVGTVVVGVTVVAGTVAGRTDTAGLLQPIHHLSAGYRADSATTPRAMHQAATPPPPCPEHCHLLQEECPCHPQQCPRESPGAELCSDTPPGRRQQTVP